MAKLDLNLLQVFDALIELRSVTRVADRLGLTPSAVSHSLRRLRAMLGDPLFVRGPRGLQASARAEQIAPGVRASLQQLRDALAPPHFLPGSATQAFTIAAGSYFCTLVIPPLLERLRVEAPGVALHIVPLVEDGSAMLDSGMIHLALGAAHDMPSRFVIETLFVEEMVWIAATSNPLVGRSPDPAEILAHPQVRLVTARPSPASRSLGDDVALAIQQPPPWGAASPVPAPATAYDSHTATMIVARTDLVACIPRRIAERQSSRDDIAILMPAGDEQRISVAMVWHGRNRSDAALGWLRSLIAAVANDRASTG